MTRLPSERLALYVIGAAAAAFLAIGVLALALKDAAPETRAAYLLFEAGVGFSVLLCGALALVRRDLARRADYSQRLRDLAYCDPLTGLPNRRAFDAALAVACSDLRKRGRPFAVVLADLDLFKGINDRYGHPCGDDVLRWTAKRLRAALREGDEAARIGGEEFAVILRDVDRPGIKAAVERLRTRFAAEPYVGRDAQGRPLRLEVTLSFGVAAATRYPEAVRRNLLARADAALYAAKRRGRDRVETASSVVTIA